MMKERNSNIEILRILCIVMIISMHVFGLYSDNLDTIGFATLSFNNAVCNMGVSIFMLISGYYGIHFKTKKLLSIWNVTLFWSLVLIFVDTDNSAKNLVRSIFPVFTGKYWFLTAYILVFCLSSYIEKLIQNINKRQFQILLCVLLLFFVIAPSFLMLEIMHDSGKGAMNMLMVYLLGRYFAMYGLPKRLSGPIGGVILLSVILIISGVDFFVSLRINFLFQMLARDNSFLILLAAVTLFTMVMQMKPRTITWVNHLASYVFPIYVIHGVLVLRTVFIPERMYSLLYLMIWLNAIIISLEAIALEFVRRLLICRLFDGLLRNELAMINMIRNNNRFKEYVAWFWG